MITVISKHMARSAAFLGSRADSRFLGIVHLVETCRYHLYRYEMLATGQGEAPPGFEPGINIPQPDKNHELDHLYRYMVMWIEVEAFLLSGKRFLDNCWCLLAEYYMNGADRISTLAGALNEEILTRIVKSKDLQDRIRCDRYYCELQRIWNEWGREFADLRNYIEHEIPFGGMAFSDCTIWIHEGRQCVDPFMPDHIKIENRRISKREFTFKNKRSLTNYMRNRMDDIDKLVETLFPVPQGHPLVE